MQVYELITCVQRANENAGNVISVVQFLINIYTYILISFIPRKKCGTPQIKEPNETSRGGRKGFAFEKSAEFIGSELL